jgi:hypothetical protein
VQLHFDYLLCIQGSASRRQGKTRVEPTAPFAANGKYPDHFFGV